jgi:hypothetical protein
MRRITSYVIGILKTSPAPRFRAGRVFPLLYLSHSVPSLSAIMSYRPNYRDRSTTLRNNSFARAKSTESHGEATAAVLSELIARFIAHRH